MAGLADDIAINVQGVSRVNGIKLSGLSLSLYGFFFRSKGKNASTRIFSNGETSAPSHSDLAAGVLFITCSSKSTGSWRLMDAL